ncbi:D-threo-aldose 1-dehydrogenase [Agromyces flavus]|uniref:D-threo-aldose 1-dehydrogenase n=1 Tax=Agromyces flavus TaxID=589382 RepID=A0A1H1XUV3_9MICO|nr:aldo/keto reductase [Agromyces flavus]MCP2366516.1 D-threo-aldose 1-dehydrogenase [Agromyces flavus]GGI44832.1 oxidoreductase [Agromyces flavus]SDT13030.1 D-threo-aldose 1-dehydrogenase [Agromyces flavus]
MTEVATRELGRTGLTITELCLGTSPLASMPYLYGHEVDEDRAVDTVLAALESPIRFIDTSNNYGEHGDAERRIGEALRRVGGLPADVVLATKVDPLHGSDDFSGRRVRESLAESLERLGVDRVPLLHLHDAERIGVDAALAPDGPIAALRELREEGAVDWIGLAGGTLAVARPLMETGVFDVVLTHNRYTLLDRSADELIDRATEMGLGVLNAAPYGGGLLAKGPGATSKYAYGERPDLQSAAAAMASACEEFGVPLSAAALQFSTRDRRIHSTIVGVSAPERIAQTLESYATPIPAELWVRLDELVPPRASWIGDR